MLRSITKLTAALVLLSMAALSAGGLPPSTVTEDYRETADRIIKAAMADEAGWDKLTHLTLRIGHRLTGSQALEDAIQWANRVMEKEGLDNVQLQPVTVPHWVRGEESARLISPVEKSLAMLGLGMSVGTPPEGIRAPVVVVTSFDELKELGAEKVRGKIVLYAVEWEGYGRTVQFRSRGASEAAKLGAVAALVRSATGRSIYSPHTGALRYAEDVPKIPAAALTVEDAMWLKHLAAEGEEPVIELKMEARMLPDAQSFNVIAEITGSEKPEEVVVIGGHYDSWDVGHGAHDDGAGAIAAWHAVTLLKQMGLRPRRTLRVVLWTNEENGLRGGRAYRELAGDNVTNHVAAIEMDGGAERPVGFSFGYGPPIPDQPWRSDLNGPEAKQAEATLKQIAALLDSIDAGQITTPGGGADIGPLMREGVPGLGLRTVGEHYFDWHHTRADTLDKIEPENFRKAVAMLAVMGYVLADMPERLINE